MVDNNEIQTQQTSFEEKMNKMFKEMDEERERFYKPYWKAKGAYSVLHRSIEMTEEHDKNWEEFLKDCPYWNDWRNNLGSFRKVSDLSYYCLRLSEIIKYKDGVSDYGFIRSGEVLDKVNKFAWRLMIMKREDFHKEFGGYFDKSTENYMIDSNGTFFNSLFDNVDNNFIDKGDFIASITELDDDEEVIQDNLSNEVPPSSSNLTSGKNGINTDKKDDKKRKNESDEGNNNHGSTWGKIKSFLPSINIKKKKTKPFEKEYKLALWRRENWKEKDYFDNHETKEGLEIWIKELEIRRNISEWGFYLVGEEKREALVNQSALVKDSNGLTINNVNDSRKVLFKGKNLPIESWIRIEQEKNSQIGHQYSKNYQQVFISRPSVNSNNFPKPLIFGGSVLVVLTFGVVVYRIRRSKFRVKK